VSIGVSMRKSVIGLVSVFMHVHKVSYGSPNDGDGQIPYQLSGLDLRGTFARNIKNNKFSVQ